MASEHPSGSGSLVSIKGHPIHPMLVSFPIAFLVGASYQILRSCSSAAYWLFIIKSRAFRGAVMGPVMSNT